MEQGRRMTDISDEESTVIGKGLNIRGEITGSAPIEVWGSIEGKAETSGLCWVREGGKVDGEVIATNVAVEGVIQGKIVAKERVELRAAAEVRGEISTNSLAIADGSFFQGQVDMKGDGGKSRPTRFEEKRKP